MTGLQRLQAEQRDLVNLVYSAGEFLFRGVVQAFLEGGEDLVPVAALYRHDEDEAELLLVGRVEFGEAGEFFGSAFVNAGAGLLRGAGRSQFATYGSLAGQVRVRVDQRQLGFARSLEQDLRHALEQYLDDVQGLFDAQVIGLLRDPGRMLVDVGEGGDKGVAVHAGRLDRLEAAHFALSCLKGWVACQWRAISTRRANHTCS